MPMWFTRLFYALMIFPSLAFNGHTSDDEFEGVYELCRQGLNVSGGYTNSAWPTSLIEILEGHWSPPPPLATPDAPNIPSNKNAQKKPQEEDCLENSRDEEYEDRQSFSAQEEDEDAFHPPISGLTKFEEAEIRANINRKQDRNPFLFNLLRTLKSEGTCEYDTLRNKVTSEGKKIYALCGFCRDYGWIKSVGLGIWDITTKGLYALSVLGTKKLIETTTKKKRDRQMQQEEWDEDEDEKDLPAPRKQKQKRKKTKASSKHWPEEFWKCSKPERHLAILKVLENGGHYTAREIHKQIQFSTVILEHVKSRIGRQKEKGWIQLNKEHSAYSITQKGLDIIEKCGGREPAELIEEQKNLPMENYHSPDPQKQSNTSPLRTRSMNDLYDEEIHQPRMPLSLPRPAELKKRRLAIDDSSPEEDSISKPPTEVVKKEVVDQIPYPIIEIVLEPPLPQFYWEQLPEKIRQNLLEQLENDIMPSVLTDGQRMQGIMEGNFLHNLHQEISAVFFKKYQIKIDNWLDIHLKERIKVMFKNSNSD